MLKMCCLQHEDLGKGCKGQSSKASLSQLTAGLLCWMWEGSCTKREGTALEMGGWGGQDILPEGLTRQHLYHWGGGGGGEKEDLKWGPLWFSSSNSDFFFFFLTGAGTNLQRQIRGNIVKYTFKYECKELFCLRAGRDLFQDRQPTPEYRWPDGRGRRHSWAGWKERWSWKRVKIYDFRQLCVRHVPSF